MRVNALHVKQRLDASQLRTRKAAAWRNDSQSGPSPYPNAETRIGGGVQWACVAWPLPPNSWVLGSRTFWLEAGLVQGRGEEAALRPAVAGLLHPNGRALLLDGRGVIVVGCEHCALERPIVRPQGLITELERRVVGRLIPKDLIF